jgi:acyl carrier protein
MMMGVHDRLEEVFRDFFSDDDIVIRNEMIPGDLPGWDSLAHVSLLATIENAFGIQFSDEELDELSDLGQLERTVAGKVPS